MIEVLGPASWKSLLDDERFAAARPVLRFMHERHVGITPGLAADLAGLTAQQGRVRITEDNAWNEVAVRLRCALASGERGGTHRRFVRAMTRFPLFAIGSVALPLLQYAVSRTGRNILFGGPGHPEPPDLAERYRLYRRELREQLSAVVNDQAMDLFFEERAHTLAGLIMRRIDGSRVDALAVNDQVTMPLLLRLAPDSGRERSRRRRLVLKQQLAQRRTGRRPQQDGVVGATISNSPDDIADRMFSEFLYPRILQIDRLTSGYFIRHRPPVRHHKRDVLVVGLAPPPDGYSTPARVAKVVWLDALARFAGALTAFGLLKSDFLWLEATAEGGLHGQHAALDEFPAGSRRGIRPEHSRFKGQFIDQLAWLPHFVNRVSHEPGPTLPERPAWLEDLAGLGGAKVERLRAEDRIVSWLVHAYRRGNRLLQPESGVENISAGDYRLVHFFMLLPPVRQPLERGEIMRLFSHRADVPIDAFHRYDVVTLPEKLLDLEQWDLFSSDATRNPLDQAGVPARGEPRWLQHASGVLSDYWEERLLEGVFGG